MATIADTLNDIQKLQDEMSSRRIEGKASADRAFITELMNFTTVHFLELLSHATLDALRARIEPIHHPYAEKYYAMYRQGGVLQELVRFHNISGTFVLWNIYEKYIDKVRAELAGTPEGWLKERYKRILRDIGVDKRRYDEMINEFDLVRLTRNSLHSGGVFRNRNRFTGTLKGKKYLLEAGEPVTPLRLLDVAETMWEHFVTLGERS